MISLIKKDFLTQKAMLAAMAVYILLFIIVFGEGLLISSMGAVVFVLTLTGCERDDRNKTDLLWNSLPVARWKIVAAKYLSSLAYALLTIPVYWLISVAFSRSSLAIAPISGADLVSGLGMAMLLVGLTLPVFFAWGYRETVGYLSVLALLGLGVVFFVLPRGTAPITYFLQWRGAAVPHRALFVQVLIILLGSLVSFSLAVFAYSKREFA